MNKSPFNMLIIWFSGIIGGSLIGGITNTINSFVSTQYYRNILGWTKVIDIQRAIIAQGVFEGILIGLVLSTIFVVIIGVMSNAQCSLGLGMRYLSLLFLVATFCWVLGGVFAMTLSSLSPEFYASHFYGVPEQIGPRLRYAWVGGSIWGIQFGGAAAVFVASVLFKATLKNDNKENN